MSPAPLTALFDDQIFLLQRRGGISKTFVELASALQAREDTSITMQARVSINQHLGNARCDRPAIPAVMGRLEGPLRRINRFLTPRGPFDVIHHTYYQRERLPDVDSRRSISTVHDMIPEDFPELFPSGSPHAAKMDYLRGSAGIVCVSYATLGRLRNYLDLSQKPVAVVHHGVRSGLRPGSRPSVALPERFVLHIGRRESYKHGAIVLRAFSALAQQDRTLRLVLVGGGPLTDAERELLPDVDRVLCLTPSDAQLPGIYSQALALVSASICEGFGVPVLEAMASGSPVVVTATEAHLEVAGEAGNFFAVDDVDACADAITESIAGGSAASERIRFGLQRSAEWTWEKAASELRAFYMQVVTP